MMKPGVEARDTVTGSGDEALRDKSVVVNVRVFLLDGTDLTDSLMYQAPMRIDLRRRDCIAGLRYGIEGMRVGGKRTLTISPHLAYGAKGVPDRVPPNATLRCEVVLLEVRERGVRKPEDYPPGRQLAVFNTGDIRHGVARWQFGLHQDGRCGASVTIPVPDLKWRHLRPKHVALQMNSTRATSLIESAVDLPNRFPQECLAPSSVYVDHSGHDGGVHKARNGDALCLSVTVWERGQSVCHYFLAEDCQAWTTSDLHKVVRDLIAPILTVEKQNGTQRCRLP